MTTENRRQPRVRTILTGTVAGKADRLFATVAVKNFSGGGAMLKFGSAGALPETFELTINARPERYQATSVWRAGDTVGVALTPIVVSDKRCEARARQAERERKALRAKRNLQNIGW